MKDERQQVLNQIRAALSGGHLPDARASVPAHSEPEQRDGAALMESFRREVEQLGASIHPAEDEEHAIEKVLELLQERAGQEILTWSDADLRVPGLGQALEQRGFIRLASDMPPSPEARRAKLAELGRATAGITGALAGLADTGSFVLVSGAGRPRLASLLPEMHIALLPASALFPSLAAFFSAYPELVRDSSNLVLVSGPSRSADIELTLTRGVHGPKFVHIVLLQWQ